MFQTTLSRSPRASLLALLAILTLSVSPAAAVDILVTTDADSGAGSLREAMTTAVDGDRIVFDIATPTPTIVLLSDLPTVAVDISFANNNTDPVTIDRNGNGPLSFTGSLLDPTVLVVNTSGSSSLDADIVASAATTVFGAGAVSGNLEVPGTLAPGADSAVGTIGTLDVTGDADLTGSQLQLDISTASNDAINVSGTATVTGATLVPNFIGSDFTIGQQFLVLDSGAAIVGTFANQGDVFALPSQPFLQAAADLTLPADDFGFVIEDNGVAFTTVARGCNQASAASLLDGLLASATPPAGVTALREGSVDDVSLAFDQLSGSIYPSLLGAEINHIQNNLESVREVILWQLTTPSSKTLRPWIRGYGVTGQVDRDDCLTNGYRQRIGGMEVGCGIGGSGGLGGQFFAHLASGDVGARGVDQKADVDSYRIGGSVAFVGHVIYAITAAGGGWQDYGVRRSLNALSGSSFATSSFDGTAGFGYCELGYAAPWTPYLAMHATRVELDPFSETGDADFALSGTGGRGDSLRGVIGYSITESALTTFGVATTRLRFGWLHEYMDEFETFTSQTAAGGTLVDQGVSAGRDWGFVRTQVECGFLLGGQCQFAYEGQFNSRSSFNSLIGGLGWVY